MRVTLMLRALLRARWPQLIAFTTLAVSLAALGGSAVANGTIVWAMACVGWIAGLTVTEIANWPNRSLVPGFAHTLFHMMLVVVCVVPLAFGALWTAVGNGTPPYGPGLLAGTATALYFVRFGTTPASMGIAVIVLFPASSLYLLLVGPFRDLAPIESLTDPQLQLPSLALAALVLFLTKRELAKPVPEVSPTFPTSLWQPPPDVKLPMGAARQTTLAHEIALAGPILALAFLLLLVGQAGAYIASIVFTATCWITAYVRVVFLMGNIHVVLCLHWFAGTADTRQGLGRKCSTAIMVRGLAWLPVALLGAAILQLEDMYRGTQFDEVMLASLALLLFVGLALGTVGRLPLQGRWWPFAGGLAGTFAFTIQGIELGWVGRLVLVIVLAGTATATWHVVGRALSRVEIAA